MKILHSADWHLGRVYHGMSLLEDQAHVLAQFVVCVRNRKPDVVVIAGDIYDRAIPPSEAIRLLDETLTRVVIELGVPVILIAGNHDGPERLGFGSRLLEAAGLTVRGNISADCAPVVIKDAHGSVAIYPLPYAEPAVVKSTLGIEDVTDHHQSLKMQLDRVRASHDPDHRSIVVSHAFVQGCSVSDSERQLSVGGTGSVGMDVFNGFNYVALGHLHRPQSLDGQRIHYAGSLMKYSFAEVDHNKSASLVDLDAQGNVSIEFIELKPRRDLRIITGLLEDLVAQGLEDHRRDDFILARLTDHGAILDSMGKLRSAYPNALSIERIEHEAGSGIANTNDHRKIGTDALFASFYKEMTGLELQNDALAMLNSQITAIESAAREISQ